MLVPVHEDKHHVIAESEKTKNKGKEEIMTAEDAETRKILHK